MKIRTAGMKAFNIFNTFFLCLAGLTCVLPFLNMVAISFSGDFAVGANLVGFWPVDFTIEAYKQVIQRAAFLQSLLVSFERVLLGATINVFLVVISAYPLSKPNEKMKHRTLYVWFFFITMLFSGGLIPNYILVQSLGLIDTIWALVLPGAVTVFNIILMLNFFRTIPVEMEDAAYVDGAGHLRILFRIFIPCSLPAIATITLFCVVGHWNAWFDGLIYMNNVKNYPMQSYLQTIIVGLDFEKMTPEDMMRLSELNIRTIKTAQMVVGAIPILLAYPFLQRYFVSGIVLGSVKG